MKSLIILFFIFSTTISASISQTTGIVKSGSIEYEKSVNMHALFRKKIDKKNEASMIGQYENYRKNQPQFKVMKSVLTFAVNKTLFEPVPENVPPQSMDIVSIALKDPITEQNNVIYNDFYAKRNTSQKKVFGETFLIKEDIKKIKWKITNETREIAGYVCRRANGLLLDSIYVVAFYTDRIASSGGPESFTGLPGMILGVALPHENITWFATKINIGNVSGNVILPPVKGKGVNENEFKKIIYDMSKSWDATMLRYLKGIFL